MNREMIDRLIARLREHPERYNQGTFCSNYSGSMCGSPCCLAGHILELEHDGVLTYVEGNLFLKKRDGTIISVDPTPDASNILWIPINDGYRIFGFGISWPGEFGRRFALAQTREDQNDLEGGESTVDVAISLLEEMRRLGYVPVEY